MKHTLEEKRDIVRQIKRGRPLSSLCKALHLDRHMVRDWLLRYEKYGDQGLRIRTPKYHFNTQEKERIIWEHTKKRISLNLPSREGPGVCDARAKLPQIKSNHPKPTDTSSQNSNKTSHPLPHFSP